MSWAILIALGRILVEPDTVQPDVEDDVILLVKRQNVTIGCTADGGGVLGDAATDAMIDAPPDSGIADASIDDGGVPDAGMPDAATCEMIPGDAVTMIVQPRVSTSADGTRFAVLLVTPERPLVEVKSQVFEPLASLTAPVMEINEIKVPDPSLGTVCSSSYSGGGCGGWGFGGGGGGGPVYNPPPLGDASLGDGGIVEETVGPYQFVRAQPTSSAELATWLDQLGYAYMPADLDAVAPYIALGYHVIAMRIAADTMTGSLVPIALTWPGSEMRVPAALGRGGGAGFAITVYIAADRKYVLPGAKVRFAMSVRSNDTPYLTRNEITLDQNQPVTSDPIAVHTDDLTVQEVNVVTQYVHVPAPVRCEDDDGGCCGNCNAKPRARLDWGVLAIAVLVVLRRRRRRR